MKAHLHTPVCLAERSMEWTDYVMVNPIQASDARYVYALRRGQETQHKFVSLNHGRHELGNPIDMQGFHDIMHQVDPNEVVLPDYNGNAMKTCGQSFEWMDQLNGMGYEGSYMLVPQGETVEDWKWCIKQIIRNRGDRISAIGIPRGIEFDRRDLILSCLEDVELAQYVRGRQPFHLLGMRESLDELSLLNELNLIRSVNTKWPVLAGMKLMRLNECNNLPEENGFEYAPINAFSPMPVNEDVIYERIHSNVFIFLSTIGVEANGYK